MKTVVIWDQCGQEAVQFFVVDEDVTRFNQLYINTYTKDKKQAKLLDELSAFTYDAEGNFLHTLLDDFPVEAVKQGAAVIVCGFLP